MYVSTFVSLYQIKLALVNNFVACLVADIVTFFTVLPKIGVQLQVKSLD